MNIDEVDYKEKYLKIEKELKKAREELKLKDEAISSLKTKNTKYYNLVEEMKEVNKSLASRVKELTSIISDKDSIIMKRDAEIQSLLEIRKNYNALANKNINLKEQIKKLNAENKKCRADLENIKNSDLSQIEIARLKAAEISLKHQLAGSNNKYIALKEKYEEVFEEFDRFYNSRRHHIVVDELIERLTRSFTLTSSLSYSKIIPFAKRVERCIELRYSLQDVNKEVAADMDKGCVVFGYLIEENEEFRFISLEGEKYKALNVPTAFRYDAPAKAVAYEDGTVTILYVYNEQEDKFYGEMDRVKKAEANNNEKKLKEDLAYTIGNFKVLIISGRKEKYYEEDLERLGLQVTTYNPFAENENELVNKMDQQDVVIVMQNAVSHSVTNLLDKTDARIQFLTRDNIKYIVARIRYALIQNGRLLLDGQ